MTAHSGPTRARVRRHERSTRRCSRTPSRRGETSSPKPRSTTSLANSRWTMTASSPPRMSSVSSSLAAASPRRRRRRRRRPHPKLPKLPLRRHPRVARRRRRRRRQRHKREEKPRTRPRTGYTQYKLYGTCYMGHILGLVEMLDKIGDKTSLFRGKYGTVRD